MDNRSLQMNELVGHPKVRVWATLTQRQYLQLYGVGVYSFGKAFLWKILLKRVFVRSGTDVNKKVWLTMNVQVHHKVFLWG